MTTSDERTMHPQPHADCPWCKARFADVPDLLEHVVDTHLADRAVA